MSDKVKLELQVLLQKVEEETANNPFMKVFNAVNAELNKEGQFLNAKELLKIIEVNSMFDNPMLIVGFFQAHTRRQRDINIEKSFAQVDYI